MHIVHRVKIPMKLSKRMSMAYDKMFSIFVPVQSLLMFLQRRHWTDHVGSRAIHVVQIWKNGSWLTANRCMEPALVDDEANASRNCCDRNCYQPYNRCLRCRARPFRHRYDVRVMHDSLFLCFVLSTNDAAKLSLVPQFHVKIILISYTVSK